jgi:hypothetical protein
MSLNADQPALATSAGHGNWETFPYPVETLYKAAEEWAKPLQGVEKPWLCWSVNPRWNMVQQRLVQHAGWTPVVGWDPRTPQPPLVEGAIPIDFNKQFQFPVMFFMFPLEFAHCFTPRLAFWHADLLCRLPVMEDLAQRFEQLKDGEMAAVLDKGGRRNLLSPLKHRYWELLGCTTRGASEHQFQHGAGWWRSFQKHPNCPESERAERDKIYYDFGMGIMFWKRHHGGRVIEINRTLVEEGHCTSIGKKDYKRVSQEGDLRNMSEELDLNYSLEEVTNRLGIRHLLD